MNKLVLHATFLFIIFTNTHRGNKKKKIVVYLWILKLFYILKKDSNFFHKLVDWSLLNFFAFGSVNFKRSILRTSTFLFIKLSVLSVSASYLRKKKRSLLHFLRWGNYWRLHLIFLYNILNCIFEYFISIFIIFILVENNC